MTLLCVFLFLQSSSVGAEVEQTMLTKLLLNENSVKKKFVIYSDSSEHVKC